MMRLPPGEPMTRTRRPSWSNTMVGAIELRGRLPGSTRLATGRPSRSGTKAKSVSSLLSMKPRTMSCAPNACSMLLVSATALPASSTTERWLVDGMPSAGSSGQSKPRRSGSVAGRGLAHGVAGIDQRLRVAR